MAETDISILVKVRDEASAAMGKISGTVNNLQPAFQTMAVAGTAALGAIGAIAYKTISDFAQTEKAQKQLEHATLQVAKGTREQLKALQDLSVELERKGVLDGDAIATGLAQLQTFGLSSDMVKKLGSSMADLAVNQFGVNAGAEQLTNTANIMAKALNGQFGVLEKSGIRFTDAQKKLIQFGTETEKVAALQEGLAQNLKYTNEVAGQTVEGNIAKLKVQLGNISENIGAALVPALTQLLQKIKPIVDKIVEWTGKHPDLIVGILAVAAGAAAIVTAIGLIGIAIPAVITGLGLLGGAMVALPVVGLIAVIGLIVFWIYKMMDEVGGAKIFFQQTWDGIKIIFDEAITAIANFFREGWDGIKIYIQEVWSSISNFFSQGWEFLKNLFLTVLDLFLTGWTTTWNAIKAVGVAIWEGIKVVVKAGWDFILGIFNAALAPFEAAFGAIWERAKGIAVSAWDGIKTIVVGSINWIIEKINGFIDKVNSVASAAAGIVKIKAPQIGNIPKLAQGGIVTKPTLAMIGEAGAEAVVPLTRGRGAMGGFGGITVVLQGTFLTDAEQTEYYGGLLANAIKQQVRI